MRTNPFYDAWLFLIGSTSDHENSGVGWLLTILFIALLLGSIRMARLNWQQGPGHRSRPRRAPCSRAVPFVGDGRVGRICRKIA